MSFSLSKSSNEVAKWWGGPEYSGGIKRLSQVIGQFCATDVPYLPGELFVRSVTFEKSGRNLVPISQRMWGPHGCLRWFKGIEFHIHKVIRTTPCTIKARLLRKVYAYGKLHFQFDINNLAGIFIAETPSNIIRTFRPTQKDHNSSTVFQKLDLKNGIVLTKQSLMLYPYELLYDAENEKLIQNNNAKYYQVFLTME